MDVNKNEPLDFSFGSTIAGVVQKAAIAAAKMRGLGDEKNADKAAVDAMRSALNNINIDGRIVIGEGERDEAPMLYIGEKVGTGKGPAIDIALDPLEGTTLCAKNQANSLAVIAFAHRGNLLYAPDVYMQKIAVGPGFANNIVDIDASVSENINNLAKAKGVKPQEIKACVMERDRHNKIIADLHKIGCSVKLISDGDIAAIIEVAQSKLDIFLGIGGAPEGVLASAALRCLGGQIYGRLILDSDEKIKRAETMGVSDPNKIYSTEEMAKGDVIFAACGVTNGEMLKGVSFDNDQITTESLILMSGNRSISRIITSFI